MLERAADPVCVERQTPAAAATIRWRANPPARRLWSLHTQAPEAQPLSGSSRMPRITANDPCQCAIAAFKCSWPVSAPVKGFGCRPVRDGSDVAVGPAFESFQGRKPRDGEAPATLPRPMGISPGGEGLGEGLRRASTVRRVLL